jgi:[calcium/calmodulin-dependent protein kinase] kinase
LKKLDHPNIIKLYEILHNYQKEKIYLILEYAEYGDIVDYDEESGIFSINKHISEIYDKKEKDKKSFNGKKYYEEDDINMFCKNILLGINYLHKYGIIHHDIKPNNILLCKKGVCKITDFNFSSILDNLNVDNIGDNVDCADNFRAPETLKIVTDNNKEEKNKKEENNTNAIRGKPLDIWALGITIYIMAYLKFPFDSDKGILDLYNVIKNEKVKFPKEPFYHKKIKYLIEKCLEKDPNKRKTADDILKMLVVHKFERLEKYEPIFLKKNLEIEISIEELCTSLDFFHNECNAVFENPKDKNNPIVYKYKKKLITFQIPKGRSLNKNDFIKNMQIPKNVQETNIVFEPTCKIITEKIPAEVPDKVPIPKTISIKTIQIYEVDDEKKNPVLVRKSIQIQKEDNQNVEEKNIVVDYKDSNNESEEGKFALKKYISDK